MMGVANAEHLESMMRYCKDPINNPKPSLRITSIKEYKDITETLLKIVTGATAGPDDKKKSSPMLAALSSHDDKRLPAKNSAEEESEAEVSIMDM
jgi:hypothetical protein